MFMTLYQWMCLTFSNIADLSSLLRFQIVSQQLRFCTIDCKVVILNHRSAREPLFGSEASATTLEFDSLSVLSDFDASSQSDK